MAYKRTVVLKLEGHERALMTDNARMEQGTRILTDDLLRHAAILYETRQELWQSLREHHPEIPEGTVYFDLLTGEIFERTWDESAE